MEFFDIVYAFQYIGDVVDPALLDSEFLDGLVEVDGAVFAVLDELDELLGEYG